MTFADLGLPPALVAGLAKAEITEPTPIQAESVPMLLAGKSAYLHAETGTGKTLAYFLPLFCRIDPTLKATQVIVLAPTHELAIQIQREAVLLAANSGVPVTSALLIGAVGMTRQIDKLKKKPSIVIGSPGRIRDLMGLNKLKAKGLKCIVIDEADRLLGGEFLESVRAIVKAAPGDRQLIFASATERRECTKESTALAPELVLVRASLSPVNANIDHSYFVCEARDKVELLRKFLNAVTPQRAIVFVHRNDRAEELTAKLAHHQVAVADLHSARDKMERKKAMDDFRSAKVHVMIASDLAARGLDIKGVSHIINLDVPTESQAYLHRVGRTGRAGAEGHAVSLMTEMETRLVRRYETELGIRMNQVRLREGKVLPVQT
jgi:superfamily II DNA/RNA helicase